MNDIERMRKRKHLAKWLSDFYIEITVTWPGGLVAWLWAVVLFITPVGLIVLSIWFTNRLRRNKGSK